MKLFYTFFFFTCMSNHQDIYFTFFFLIIRVTLISKIQSFKCMIPWYVMYVLRCVFVLRLDCGGVRPTALSSK